MTFWTDVPCSFHPPHAPHLWGEEVISGTGTITYTSQYVHRCDGVGRSDPDA